MAVLTPGLEGSVQLFISLSTVVFIVHSFKGHVKGVPLEWSFCNEKTRRLLECVHTCIQHPDCRSLGYENISTQCYFHLADTQNGSATLLFGHLTELPRGGGEGIFDHTTQFPTSPVVLMRGRMNWRQAQKACKKAGMQLLRIESDTTQATAVAMANETGLEIIAFGIYRLNYKWIDMDHNDLLYTAWAEGAPGLLDPFAALSRKSGYKWEGIGYWQRVDGRLCQ